MDTNRFSDPYGRPADPPIYPYFVPSPAPPTPRPPRRTRLALTLVGVAVLSATVGSASTLGMLGVLGIGLPAPASSTPVVAAQPPVDLATQSSATPAPAASAGPAALDLTDVVAA